MTTTIQQHVRKHRNLSLVEDLMKKVVTEKMIQLKGGVLNPARGEKLNSQLDDIDAAIKVLRQIATHAIENTQPAADPMVVLPPNVDQIIEQRVQERLDQMKKSSSPKGTYVTKSGRVFKTKPGRYAKKVS